MVDDEPDILEIVEYNLRKEGYTVFTAANGAEGVDAAKKIKPDLIILDIMMPVMDGIEACRHLRANYEFKNTLIVFLTARNEEYSQIAGFDVGADDYISKPVKPRVLISRIKALLRRANGENETLVAPSINIGGLNIDRERYVVTRNNEEHYLPRKQFEFLALLATKPGRVFKRGEILATIWGGEVVVGDRTIDVHIRKIREKLGDDVIKTVKGVGYKIEA